MTGGHVVSDNPWLEGLARLAIIAVLVPVGVIVLTWVERKVIGRLQMRLGPMRVGPYGTLQGIADTIKLLTKEDLRPQTADRWTFELAPFVIVVPVFLAFVTLPFTADLFVRNLTLGLFYIVAVSGLSIFGVAGLAELYRQPFDIPVAESEVVGGPFVEYSGIRWSMFQMAEFVNMVLISVLGSLLFLGGWNWPLGNEVGAALQVPLILVKTSAFILMFMWLRGSPPRLCIRQLMAFCWQILLPFAFLQIIINGWVLVYDWPDWVMGVLSGLAPEAGLYLTQRGAQ